MTTIHFVRHGCVRRLGADPDPGLTSFGRRQAQATAAHFASLAVHAVFASDLRRARETATCLAELHTLPVQTDARLRERANFDAAAGLTLDEFLAVWDRACREREWQPPVGVSSHACALRMVAFCRDCFGQFPSGTVLAATHGGAVADFLATEFPHDQIEAVNPALAADLYDGRVMQECSITTIVLDANDMRLIAAAQRGHLP